MNLLFFVNKFKPDIISINETKCDDETAENNLQIENYYLIHKARSIKSNGAGGVALLIKKGIKYEETNIFDTVKPGYSKLEGTFKNG
jgi:exonuclease III